MSTVELRNVSKRYGDITVVRDLSLQINHGELVALLGPSGCGKTTTLQMLAGFTEITSGEIEIDGKPIKNVPPHQRNIGVVFQSYALFPHLNVFDNVAFGLRMRNVRSEQIKPRVARALDIVQLSGMEIRYPRALSGGQQQRVALARALVIEPEVLLLDEPLSNLDANLREQMRFEIREIQKRIGITTVFVTHDQAEAMAVADRLVVMSKGVIRQVGTAQEIYQAPSDLFVAEFIGQANMLRVQVQAVDGDVLTLALADGTNVRIRSVQHVHVGQAARLALRPEMLRLDTQTSEGLNHLAGVIERVNYLGSVVNIGVRCVGQSMTVLLPSEQHPGWSEGQAVQVQWPLSSGLVFVEPA